MRWTVVASLLLVVASGPSLPEEVEGRWRLGGAIGGFSPQSEIESDSANVLGLYSPAGEIELLFIDPREDSARFGTLAVQPGSAIRLVGQYGVTRTFVLEGTVGYSRTDLGDVEMQVEFVDPVTFDDIGFAFDVRRVRAGDVELVPLQLSGLVRFRPAASFNPYIGGGIGYLFTGFEPTQEFDDLSRRLDDSLGIQGRLLPGEVLADPNPRIFVSPNVVPQNLSGAQVDVSDSFTWHVQFGAEYAVSRRWALAVDFRYVWSSREVSIGFNGGEDLGISVPQGGDFVGSDAANGIYGPMFIRTGGLADGGSYVPRPEFSPSTDCRAQPTRCFFSAAARDGLVDPGYYYLNGGRIDLGAFWFSLGASYTF